MRIGTVLTVGTAALTAAGSVGLAIYVAVCDGCGKVPTHHVAAPPTPGLIPSSTNPSPRATSGGGTRLSRALLTGFGSARVVLPTRSGTYGDLAGVPLKRGTVANALTGKTPVTPRGCGTFPPAGWTRTATSAPAATVTLKLGGQPAYLREILLAPRTHPAGLVLLARCHAFTLADGVPARAAPLRPYGVGDAAAGAVTLVGRPGAAKRVILYTIVFRVGKVYGVVHAAATGPNPSGTTVRKAALLYAQRAATHARGLS